MKTNFKKFLSIMLALFMLLSVVPMGTFAAEADAAAIGETGYATLAEAMAEANKAAGDYTITLLKDSAEVFTFAQKSGVNITVDGDGNTFSGKITLNAGAGKLTFTDAKIAPANSQSIVLKASTAPDVVFDDCILEGKNKSGAIVYGDASYTDTNVVIKNSEASNLQYIVSYRQTGSKTLLVENVTATDMTYLIRPLKCPSVTVKDVTCDAVIGIQIRNDGYGHLTLENVSINACEYNGGYYAPVSGSGAGANYDITVKGNNTFTKGGVAYEGNAWFSGNEGFKLTVERSFVAAIGETGYATLADAISAAKAGNTITLLADVNEDVTVDKKLTIDGADYTYTGKMTLKADATIKNVNFDGKGYNGYAVETRGAQYLTIEDCTAKNYGYGFVQLASATALTTVKNVDISNVNYGIKVDYSGKVVVENADITAKVAGILNSNYGEKTITVKDSKINIIGTWVRNNTVKTVIVFEGENTVDQFITDAALDTFKLAAGATLTASADLDVTTDVADHEVVYENGVYSVVESVKAVAAIGDALYASLKAAVAAAEDGDVITVLADHELENGDAEIADYDMYAYLAVSDKKITIDLNGKTITATPDFEKEFYGVVVVNGTGDLTLTDSSEDMTGAIRVTAADDTAVYSMISTDGEASKLTINGGNYEINRVDKGYAMIYVAQTGTGYVNGGNFVLGNAKTILRQGVLAPWIFNCYANGENVVYVNGGTYNTDPTHHWGEAKFPKGYVATVGEDGMWSIVRGPVVMKQPTDITVGYGKMAKFAPEIRGEGLTYTWYYKDANDIVFRKSTLKTATYDIKGLVERDGRQIYCVATDAYGKKVTTETVTLTVVPNEELKIVSQPTVVEGALDKTVSIAMDVTGDDLTYKWYFRDKGAKNFQKSSLTSATYDIVLTKARMGREVYCEIIDAFGEKVTSEVVTIKAVKSVELKVSALSYDPVAVGETVTVKMDAEGEYLTYTWYFRDAKSSKDTKSSIKDSEYSVVLTEARVGRQVYCVVTDAFGDSVTTEPIVIK